MNQKDFLSILSVAEKLKCNTRHSDTSTGRRESVAEHSWRLALMAMLLEDEFPELDMDKVIKMCLIHDLGEAFTGDIPTFLKTDADAEKEDNILLRWVDTLPEFQRSQFKELLTEMLALQTPEARLYKSLDKMEAVIQHNEADISSWLPLEYDLQLTYGAEEVKCAPYMMELKAQIDKWTREKISASMELWDAYSKDEELTDSTLVRGEEIPQGLYHLVCEVLVRHTDGSYLCMKRSVQKPNYGGWYEATAGGSALAGEDKWQCVKRELFEETGLVCCEFEEIDCFLEERKQAFFHVFVCTVDCDKSSVQLQEGETEGYLWMSEAEFIKFVNSDRIIPSNRRRYDKYFQRMGYVEQNEASQ